jgi:hypothetical protein
MKPPTKIKEPQMFLGFIEHFANYVPVYIWVTRPLYHQLSKDVQWTWDSLYQETYKSCKLALNSMPILGLPPSEKEYHLSNDANDFCIGAVLQQVQPIKIRDLQGTQLYDQLWQLHRTGDPPPQLVIIPTRDERRPKPMAWNDEFNETEVCIERVIAYWSRILTSTEKDYSPTKKEALALRGALIKFRPLIKGETIAVMTDVFSAYPRLSVTHQMG